MGIPRPHWDLVAASWQAGEPELYGRFDLAYDGEGPAKLLEYNADTPTSLYESASFQWLWFEQQQAARVLPQSADQFNGLHEALVARFAQIFAADTDVHFAAIADAPEDYATVETLAWAAREAGLGAHYTDLDKIGITAAGQFTDSEDRVIGAQHGLIGVWRKTGLLALFELRIGEGRVVVANQRRVKRVFRKLCLNQHLARQRSPTGAPGHLHQLGEQAFRRTPVSGE